MMNNVVLMFSQTGERTSYEQGEYRTVRESIVRSWG